jgi:hypothetical protein
MSFALLFACADQDALKVLLWSKMSRGAAASEGFVAKGADVGLGDRSSCGLMSEG